MSIFKPLYNVYAKFAFWVFPQHNETPTPIVNYCLNKINMFSYKTYSVYNLHDYYAEYFDLDDYHNVFRISFNYPYFCFPDKDWRLLLFTTLWDSSDKHVCALSESPFIVRHVTRDVFIHLFDNEGMLFSVLMFTFSYDANSFSAPVNSIDASFTRHCIISACMDYIKSMKTSDKCDEMYIMVDTALIRDYEDDDDDYEDCCAEYFDLDNDDDGN